MDDVTQPVSEAKWNGEYTRPKEETQSVGLAAVSWLLTYPQEGAWLEGLHELQGEIAAAPAKTAQLLAPVLTEFLQAPVTRLQRGYVETFDFSDKRTLYLTAHELGDSRKRGTALIECRQMLEQAGYELVGSELPDYLPLLLEFLAVVPASEDALALGQRLALVCAEIAEALPNESPYRPVLAAALDLLPQAPANSGRGAREQADLAELPYPLHYD